MTVIKADFPYWGKINFKSGYLVTNEPPLESVVGLDLKHKGESKETVRFACSLTGFLNQQTKQLGRSPGIINNLES